ncbi:MAG TPA: lysylphosphatidylglycerol synthase transmembrane domain-containing protein [Cytophagaceae bacterium]|nr:lysylphosphatidylglycerol synthase transmembrane domain-containing protein [Cytophagaceae bacterium]
MKKSYQIILSLAIAVLMIAAIFIFVDPKDTWDKIKNANPYWIILALGISMLSHLSRARRWNLLLEPLGYSPSLKNTFLAIMTGYFGNIFIPRGGEVMRCVVLNRSDKIPMASSLATVVAERIIDLLCLGFLVVFSLFLEYEKFLFLIKDGLSGKNNEPGLLSKYLPWFIGIGMLFLLVLIIFRNHSFVIKIKNFIVQLFKEAYQSFIKLEKKKEFVFQTLFIWTAYYFMTYVVFFSLPFTSNLGPMAGLVILIAGAIGMSVPASGGAGSFHFFVALGLTLFYGLSQDDGVAYAFVLHSSQFVLMLVLGGVCALISFFIIGKKEIISTKEKIKS